MSNKNTKLCKNKYYGCNNRVAKHIARCSECHTKYLVRSNKDINALKCACGNVAGLGQTKCKQCHEVQLTIEKLEDKILTCKKCNELAKILLEARDALPAIPLAAAKMRGLDLSLADRIEDALEPWKTGEIK